MVHVNLVCILHIDLVCILYTDLVCILLIDLECILQGEFIHTKLYLFIFLSSPFTMCKSFPLWIANPWTEETFLFLLFNAFLSLHIFLQVCKDARHSSVLYAVVLRNKEKQGHWHLLKAASLGLERSQLTLLSSMFYIILETLFHTLTD